MISIVEKYKLFARENGVDYSFDVPSGVMFLCLCGTQEEKPSDVLQQIM